MFDTLGCNGTGHRRPQQQQRAHSCQAAFRCAKVGDEGQHRPHASGKGHMPLVEKNMPSIVGVFGDVDRLYRPELTTQLFGPPIHTVSDAVVLDAKRKATERSNQASCNYVPIKPFNGHNALHWVPTSGPQHMGHAAALRERISNEASALHQAKLLTQRAAALEHRLAACDSRIQRHQDEVGVIQCLRDIHIAKKKSKLRRLRGDRTLEHQDPLLLDALTHAAAECAANRNVVTTDRRVPTFVAGAGIPGTEGYAVAKRIRGGGGSGDHRPVSDGHRRRSSDVRADDPPLGQPPAPSVADASSRTEATLQSALTKTATTSTSCGIGVAAAVRTSAAWQDAVRISPMDLMDRVAVPMTRCTTTEPHRGPRVFPNLHSRMAPFAAEENLAMPRRQLAHANMSTPVKWFEREVKRTVDGYNRAVVFTPHLRTMPQGLRAPTIPAPTSVVVADV